MQVECKFFATIKMELGRGSFLLETQSDYLTVMEILKMLDKEFPNLILKNLVKDEGHIHIIPGAIILLNGKNILLMEKLHTHVHDGDELVLFPPVGGG